MSEAALTNGANEMQRLAERYAAELLDKLYMPTTYDEAVTMIAVAWLEGSMAQLKWARDKVRGDGVGDEARAEYRDFLRSLPEARGVNDDA